MTHTNQLLKPTHLTVNLVTFPYSVTKRPRFSWWDHCTEKGMVQTGFRIVVAKRLSDFNHQEFLYDSDWQKSADNTAVTIPELDSILRSGELYYWRVAVSDQHGHQSAFSKAQAFITAVQTPSTLHGIWSPLPIGTPTDLLPALGNVVFFRSPLFEVDLNELDKAILLVSSRGNERVMAQAMDLFVNGHAVGVAAARPHENYHGSHQTAIHYNSFEITDDLKSRENIISAVVTGTLPNRAFLGRLVLYKRDGSKQILLQTDQSWQTLDGSSAFGDNGTLIRSQYFGMMQENMNANAYPTGFSEPDYDDANWQSALVVSSPFINEKELLLPFSAENTYRYPTAVSLQTITQLSPHRFVIDLGREIIGSLKISLLSEFDQRVNILMGEQLNADGSVRHELACGPDYLENWTFKKGLNRFSTLQMKNFRYIELQGFQGNLTPGSIIGWEMRQPFDSENSRFESDNALLNQEYNMSKYTIQATNQDVFVDSQARERRPYEGDLLVNANSSYAVSSHYSLARHSLDYLLDNPTWPEDYKLFNVEMAWVDYLYTRDASELKARYQVLKVKLHRGPNGEDNFDERVGLMTNTGLIDWPVRERDGYVAGKYNTPFNAIYYGIYQIMAQIADVTGHLADITRYKQRASRIKTTLLTKLYDIKQGRFYDSMNEDGTINRHTSHHASAYALCYGVYDDQKTADRISDFVGNNGHFIGSIYFIYFMLRGLIRSGHGELAVQLLINSDDRPNAKTFAAIIKQLRATITPEAWSNYYKPNLTLSHPWGAAPGLTIVQGLMGINPLTPGFSEFSIKPQVGLLTRVKLTTPCAKGLITIDYQKQAATRQLVIKVPANSTAHVMFDQGIHEVTVDQRPTQTTPVLNGAEVKLTSGRYVIRF